MLTYITNECMPLEKMLARVEKHDPGPGRELAMCIGNMDVPIVAVSAKRDEKRKTCNITMVIQVKSREQVDRVFIQLRKRSDIIEVYRGST